VHDFSPITRCWAAQHDIYGRTLHAFFCEYGGNPALHVVVVVVVVVVVNVYVGQCGLCSHYSVHSSHRGVIQCARSPPITLEGNPCPTRPYISDCLFFVMVPILGHPPDAGEGNPTVG
jgi:hypothetical protein